jgi:outer membrane receptor protein involved in Fe transport
MSKLNPRRVPSSFTHDAGVELALQDNRYIVSFEVHNLTDEVVFNNFNQQLMGRAVYFKVRYSFVNPIH